MAQKAKETVVAGWKVDSFNFQGVNATFIQVDENGQQVAREDRNIQNLQLNADEVRTAKVIEDNPWFPAIAESLTDVLLNQVATDTTAAKEIVQKLSDKVSASKATKI